MDLGLYPAGCRTIAVYCPRDNTIVSNHPKRKKKQLYVTPVTPILISKIVWLTVSRAFFKSRKTTALTLPLSILKAQLSVASSRAVAVEWNPPSCQKDIKQLSKSIWFYTKRLAQQYRDCHQSCQYIIYVPFRWKKMWAKRSNISACKLRRSKKKMNGLKHKPKF